MKPFPMYLEDLIILLDRTEVKVMYIIINWLAILELMKNVYMLLLEYTILDIYYDLESILIHRNLSVHIIIIVDIRTCVYNIHSANRFICQQASKYSVACFVTLMLSNSCVIPWGRRCRVAIILHFFFHKIIKRYKNVAQVETSHQALITNIKHIWFVQKLILLQF